MKPVRAAISEYCPKAQGALIGDCVSVKVESGVIREKDELVLMPQNVLVQIRGIEAKNVKETRALAGLIYDMGIKLPTDFDVTTIKKGNVLCDPKYPMKFIQQFIARVIVYDIPSPIAKGEAVVVHSHTTKAPGKIAFLLATIEQSTGETVKNRPKFLRKGQFASIQIKLEERMCLELFSNYKSLGRIVIRRENHTIAAGTITEFVS